MNDNQPSLDEGTQQLATLIASVIRNAMEDFHCRHLSDQQMRELNPIVRNATATALHAFAHGYEPGAAQRYLDYHHRCVPAYWEPPQLLDGYLKMWARDRESGSS